MGILAFFQEIFSKEAKYIVMTIFQLFSDKILGGLKAFEGGGNKLFQDGIPQWKKARHPFTVGHSSIIIYNQYHGYLVQMKITS